MILIHLPSLFLLINLFKICASAETLEECSIFGKKIYVNETGVITSPGFETGQYPSRKQCTWIFTGPQNKFIHLKFTDFDLEESQQCLLDYIIIEWKAMDFESIRYCGNEIPKELTVRASQELYLLFNSDDQKQYKGFRVEYSLLDKYSPCPPRHLLCRNNNCVPRSKICDQVDDCLDGTDEEKCGYKAQKPTVCGKTPIPPEKGNDRIVGGKPSIPYSWPWQVSFQRTDVFTSGHFCGGSLINNLWIATATHCLINRDLNEIRVVLGLYNQFHKDGNEVTRYVEDSMIYPGYNDYLLKNDISVVKMNAPVLFSDRIQPICLPQRMEDLPEGKMVHVTGWGDTLVSGKSDVLKQVMHPVANWTKCKQSHADVREVFNTSFCAGYNEGGHAACHSDSGGPLVAEEADIWTLYGIVSWGPVTCALPNMPAVFTKVSSYVDFINSVYSIN